MTHRHSLAFESDWQFVRWRHSQLGGWRCSNWLNRIGPGSRKRNRRNRCVKCFFFILPAHTFWMAVRTGRILSFGTSKWIKIACSNSVWFKRIKTVRSWEKRPMTVRLLDWGRSFTFCKCNSLTTSWHTAKISASGKILDSRHGTESRMKIDEAFCYVDSVKMMS